MHSYLKKKYSRNVLILLFPTIAEFHEPSVTDYTLSKGEIFLRFFFVCVYAVYAYFREIFIDLYQIPKQNCENKIFMNYLVESLEHLVCISLVPHSVRCN